jgi:hypothetical protein
LIVASGAPVAVDERPIIPDVEGTMRVEDRHDQPRRHRPQCEGAGESWR